MIQNLVISVEVVLTMFVIMAIGMLIKRTKLMDSDAELAGNAVIFSSALS